MQLKPFNLERALAGDKVITRSGEHVPEIHYFKTTRYSRFPIVAVIEGHIRTFKINGEYSDHVNHSFDLFMATKKKKLYIAFKYIDYNGGKWASSFVYESLEEIKKNLLEHDPSWIIKEFEVEV